MNLLDIRREHPELFCPGQVWFEQEAFAHRDATPIYVMPTRSEPRAPSAREYLPRAADLAHLYVHSPNDPIWRDYLWCVDVDAEGQRVYVGGTANGRGFEVHRNLVITERWGVLSWT